MNQIVKFLAALVVALVALPSVAENLEKGIYADTIAGQMKCLADVAAGKAKWYKPSLDQPVTSPAFTKRTVAERGACLVRARVTGDDGNASQIATVAVPAGFAYAELISGGKTIEMRMAACNNLFKEVLYPPAVAPATTSSVAVTTATGAVSVSVTVNNSVTVNAGATAPAATPAATCEADCQAKLAQEKVEKRTDGACVIAFQSSADKTYRFVRFDVKTWEGKPILIGGSVTDATTAKVTGESKMSVVGTGEKNLVYMKPDATGKFDCQAAFRAVSIPQVLAWTGPRLGLTTACRPVTHSGKAS